MRRPTLRTTASWWPAVFLALALLACPLACRTKTPDKDVRPAATAEEKEKKRDSPAPGEPRALGWEKSIVRIVVDKYQFHAMGDKSVSSTGTGILVDDEGTIVTNVHVIRRARKIVVEDWYGRKYRDVKLVRKDTEYDIAVLKLLDGKPEDARPLPFADEALVRTATEVECGGCTRGACDSYHRGVVNNVLNNGYLVWHSCNIAEGASGGPMMSLDGFLLGVNWGGNDKLAKASGIRRVKQVLAGEAGVTFDERVVEHYKRTDPNMDYAMSEFGEVVRTFARCIEPGEMTKLFVQGASAMAGTDWLYTFSDTLDAGGFTYGLVSPDTGAIFGTSSAVNPTIWPFTKRRKHPLPIPLVTSAYEKKACFTFEIKKLDW